MTTATLASIRSTVRSRGDYPVSAKFTDAYANSEIQPAWSELYELVDDTYEGWWDKDATIATIAAQPYVALAADCWRVRGIDWLDGTIYRELRQVGVGDRNRWTANNGTPIAYRLTARGADLFPTPDAIYTLRLTYSPTVTPLAESTPVPMVNDWQEYIIESALLRLHKRSERPIQETWSTLFDPVNGIKARIVRAAQRKQQEPEYLQLREYAWYPEDYY